jgi:DNA-binding HxlR family transcriptional regulator
MPRSEIMPNVFEPNRRSRVLLALIAHKWSVLLIYALAGDPRRTAEVNRMVGGITQKMLTQTLRELEGAGLVDRKVYPEIPPHVEYSLSERGESLSPVLEAMCVWTQGHELDLSTPQYRPANTASQRR